MRKNEGTAVPVAMMTGSLLGGALAAAITMVLLLICSAAISAGVLAEKLELHVTIASCVIGSFFGGRLTCRRWGSRMLLAGLSAGAVFFMLLFTVSLVGYDTTDVGGAGIGVAAGCLCGGAAADLLGRGRGGGKKKKRGR